jgi:Raf kinase inhibitor-like YbhB/YbcL family protein
MRSFMIGVLVCTVSLTACSTNDGREMSPPQSGQQESVAPPTTVNDPESFDSLPDPSEGGFTVTGPWRNDDTIDERYTCDGRNISPPLSLSGIPEDAVALAIVMSDLDSPAFAHWTVANIEPATTYLSEGETPALAVVAINDEGRTGYAGPCPPKGSSHTYQIALYALGQLLEAETGDPAPALRAAIESVAIDIASTTFTYTRR